PDRGDRRAERPGARAGGRRSRRRCTRPGPGSRRAARSSGSSRSHAPAHVRSRVPARSPCPISSPAAAGSAAAEPAASTEAPEPAATKATTEPATTITTAPAAGTQDEGQEPPCTAAAAATSTPTTTAASNAAQNHEHEHDQEEHEAACTAAIATLTRLTELGDVAGQLEAELLRVHLCECDDTHQDSGAVVAALERGDHELVGDTARFRRRDECRGADAGLDLQVSATIIRRLLRDHQHDEPGVACGIARVALLSHAPLSADLQCQLISRATLEGRHRHDGDLTPGLCPHLLHDARDLRLLLGGDHIGEVVDHAYGRRDLHPLRVHHQWSSQQTRTCGSRAHKREKPFHRIRARMGDGVGASAGPGSNADVAGHGRKNNERAAALAATRDTGDVFRCETRWRGVEQRTVSTRAQSGGSSSGSFASASAMMRSSSLADVFFGFFRPGWGACFGGGDAGRDATGASSSSSSSRGSPSSAGFCHLRRRGGSGGCSSVDAVDAGGSALAATASSAAFAAMAGSGTSSPPAARSSGSLDRRFSCASPGASIPASLASAFVSGIACASASTRPPSLIARETSSDGATGDSTGFGTTAGASSGRFQSSSVSAMDGVRLSSTCGGAAESGPVCSVASTPGAGSDAGACSATSSGGRFQSSCCPVANGSSPSTGGRLQSSISGGGEDSSPSIGVTLHGSSSAMFQSSVGDVTSKPGSAQGSAGSCSLTTGLPSSSSGNGSMSSGGALSAGAGSDFLAAAVSPRPLRAVRFFFFPLRFSGSG